MWMKVVRNWSLGFGSLGGVANIVIPRQLHKQRRSLTYEASLLFVHNLELTIQHFLSINFECSWLMRENFLWRIVCPGEGLPPELVQDMFSSRWVTQEGLGLSICRKILKLMNGKLQYIRESERCYFLVVLDLPMPRRSLKIVGWFYPPSFQFSIFTYLSRSNTAEVPPRHTILRILGGHLFSSFRPHKLDYCWLVATGNTHSLWLYVSSAIFALILSGKLNFEVQTTGAISYDDERRQAAKYSSARTAEIYIVISILSHLTI